MKSMRSDPVISVVMPARNEGERVTRAILSFANRRSKLFPLEFIVVDDASADGCCKGIQTLLNWERDMAGITLITLKHWSGIPYARNIGASNASSPILFITDANVEACPSWDVPVFRELGPKRALCATIADKGSSWRGYGCLLDLPSMGIQWLRDPKAMGGYVPVAPCTGTVLYKSLYSGLGGYDTAMPVYGAAEPEFSVRLWLYGGEIICCPDLVLIHRFRPPEERQPFLDQIAILQMKNYIRFGLLYLDPEGTARMMNYWREKAPVQSLECLSQAQSEGAMERRDHLRKNLPRRFSWYSGFFGIQ